MWPTLVELEGGGGVHSYGLWVMTAFCVAFLVVHRRSLRVGLHPDRLLPVYLVAAVGGLLGGRLLYAIAVEPARTFADPASLLSFSGFAFYGGVIGGALAVMLLARVQHIPIWPLADVCAPAVVLALGIGRLGCFFAGCCHGAVAPIHQGATGLLPEGMLGGQIWVSSVFPFLTTEFHTGVGRLHDVPLYPTQLWSAVVGIALGSWLLKRWEGRSFDGQMTALTLILEPLFRCVIEMFRADQRGYLVQWPVSESVMQWFPGMTQAGVQVQTGVMGLTTSQSIGLGALLWGVVIYSQRKHTPRSPSMTPPSDPDEELFDLIEGT